MSNVLVEFENYLKVYSLLKEKHPELYYDSFLLFMQAYNFELLLDWMRTEVKK